MMIKTTIFSHRPHVSLAQFSFCWWRQNQLLMTSQWPDNCDTIAWIMTSNSLDLIHDDIHGRSCKKALYCTQHRNHRGRTYQYTRLGISTKRQPKYWPQGRSVGWQFWRQLKVFKWNHREYVLMQWQGNNEALLNPTQNNIKDSIESHCSISGCAPKCCTRQGLITLRARQDGRHFAEDSFIAFS